jgi:hypothetical protein
MFPLPAALIYPQEMPEFGSDGLAGLTLEQKQRLAKGGIILPESVVKTPEGKTLIEAVLVFDKPPGEAWRLPSKTEDQAKYLDEVKNWSLDPEFIQKALIKNNLPTALQSVKKYVHSGGTRGKNNRNSY